MAAKRVLNVGQCSYDHGNISNALQSNFGVEVVGAETTDEALILLRREAFDLVLVNRIFDLDGTEGIKLIRTLRSEPELQPTPVMLVSNFPEAQAEAVGLGAAPGFGKASVGKPEMLERVEPFLKS